MKTTIDGAGRIVVPKAIREALGLGAGQSVDISFANGRIEIDLAPAQVQLEIDERGLPRLSPESSLPPLNDEIVRDTLEATRR
ncbi:AbrB/MazE/SpoVT family DNA-binding domain-containing protein [Nostocoides jenkinsii]|uniref:SpoVT-AbrB domain-containing protein n=1 Tax=Nostocoides jenkinsii Ben 74 TaxID=1193518 RepID=A0A077M4D8_9MICO|nr:AbrB/MazE/SpoVT family DNA-binding domain-containing protein [Tetrasphaera jenkinsii]CCI52106.1 conserved hypothetical protein [Tetrasphaera jenkinsii Ben 74]